MLIEYTATDAEDRIIERALSYYHISNWFNPEEDYYVLETEDDRVVTTLALLNIDFVISSKDSS